MTDPTPSKEAAPRRRWSRLASEPNPAELDDAKPLTPEELDVIRAMPVVNRNGSTIDRVDRLLATLDAARASQPASADRPPASDNELLSERDAYMFEAGVEEGKRLASRPAPADPERCPTCGSSDPVHIARGWDTSVEPWVRCQDDWHVYRPAPAQPAPAGVRDPEPRPDLAAALRSELGWVLTYGPETWSRADLEGIQESVRRLLAHPAPKEPTDD